MISNYYYKMLWTLIKISGLFKQTRLKNYKLSSMIWIPHKYRN